MEIIDGTYNDNGSWVGTNVGRGTHHYIIDVKYYLEEKHTDHLYYDAGVDQSQGARASMAGW